MDGKLIAYKFDDVLVDLKKRQVFKAGKHVPIEPKALDVLIFLIARRERRKPPYITKDELLDGVWEDKDVFENTLVHAVAHLRGALGDDPHEPRYIKTITGHGYRFIAEVKEIWAEIESILVLPFETSGDGSDDKYMGIGMADAIITRLNNTLKLDVRQMSAMQKYTHSQDPLEAGREQEVDAVLGGSIHREGDCVRVTVRLVRVCDGKLLWNDIIDVKFTGIIALQDAVSKRVVEKLTPARRYTENEEAYLAYLKGRLHWHKRTVPGFRKAAEFYQQAIEIDPNYAPAYAGLADSYSSLGVYVELPPSEAFPKAKKAAEKALEIDPMLPDAHVALGAIRLFYDWDWPGTKQAFRRAVELNPNQSNARMWDGLGLAALGQLDEAMSEMELAIKSDPLSLIINTNLGWVHYFARDYDEASKQLRQTVEMDSNFPRAHIRLGMVYEQKEMHQKAIAEYQKARDLAGDDPYVMALLGYTYATSGQSDDVRETFDWLQEWKQQKRYVPDYSFALIHAGLGEKDRAFAWLEKAYADRFNSMIYLKVEPMLDGLRSDPRMFDLLRRMNLVS